MKQRSSSSLMAAIDSFVALALAIAAAVWADQQRMPQGGLQEFLKMRVTLLNVSFAVIFVFLWRECFDVLNLYRGRFTELLRSTLLAFAGCGIMTALLALYLEARHTEGPVPRILSAFFLFAILYAMARTLLSSPHLRWKISEPEHVVILGSGRRAGMAWRELRIKDHRTKRLLGFVDDRDPAAMPPDIAGRYLGRVDDLPLYLLHNVVDELIIAVPMRSCYDLAQRAASIAEDAGVRVRCLSDFYGLNRSRTLRARAALFLELAPKDEKHLAAESFKRVLDFTVASTGLVLLAPMFLLIALSIKLTSAGPVFFVQERYGYRRRRFPMVKFRTMVRNAPEMMAALESQNEATGPIFKIRNDPRITSFGGFLRRTSLDELPQLWNVLLGDMSLVGPRPMSVRDVSLFTKAQLMRRFSMRPGITGMWQVAGRAFFSFDQWIALDFSYIEDWSLALDLKILARTLPAVLKRSGAV